MKMMLIIIIIISGQFIKHRKWWFGPKGWIAWLANTGCTHTIFCLSLLHNWIKRKQKEMNPSWRVQDQLNTSEPTAPTDWLTDWPTDRLTDEPTDRPTYWPTDWLIDWQTDRPTDVYIFYIYIYIYIYTYCTNIQLIYVHLHISGITTELPATYYYYYYYC